MYVPGGILTSIGLIGVGLVMAFFGYRLLKVFLAVAGFALGALAAYNVLPLAGLHTPTALLIGAIVCGILGALLMFPLYLVGLFALGACSGALLVQLLGHGASPISLLIGVVAGGILAVALQRPLVILVTAIDGAAVAVIGVFAVLHPEYWHPHFAPSTLVLPVTGHHPPLFWIAVAVIALLAAGYQFRDLRNRATTSSS